MRRSGPDLKWVASRLRGDPFFLGYALELYQINHLYTDAGMARVLGCTQGALVRLALCRRPDFKEGSYVKDIQRIAAFAPCAADRLLHVLLDIEDEARPAQRSGLSSGAAPVIEMSCKGGAK